MGDQAQGLDPGQGLIPTEWGIHNIRAFRKALLAHAPLSVINEYGELGFIGPRIKFRVDILQQGQSSSSPDWAKAVAAEFVKLCVLLEL